MTVPITHAPKGIVLTVEDVARWKGELRRNREIIARLSSDSEAIETKLQAAAMFIDVGSVAEADELEPPAEPISPAPVPESEPAATLAPMKTRKTRRRKASGEPTWADVVMAAVEPADMGLTYAEVRNTVQASVLGPKLQQSDKGYHNAISRLAKDEFIVRDHGRLFKPDAYQRFLEAVEAGEASTTVPQPMAHSPMGEAILRIVGDRPGELNGKGVIAELRKDPEHNATLTPHETGAYNIIARLVRRGQIVRRDDGLILPGKNFPKDLGSDAQNDTEAPSGNAAGASEAGGGATPPNDSQSALRLIS